MPLSIKPGDTKEWLAAGVPFALSTDDEVCRASILTHEYVRAALDLKAVTRSACVSERTTSVRFTSMKIHRPLFKLPRKS